MKINKTITRAIFAAAVFAIGTMVSTGAFAQALNFSFKFTGNMSCMNSVPVSDAPISGSGTGVINPDGSVTAEITQGLLIFTTTLRFDSKLGPGLSTVPGGTAQLRVAGKQSLRFTWNLPNNSIVVVVNVRGQSCTASFQTNLLPGKSQYTFFDGSMYHYCARPTMTTSTCEIH